MIPGFLTPFRNPIFEREFIALCRTKRWFLLRTLLVAFLTIATWIVLASELGRSDRLDETGKVLFIAASMIQVGFVFFLGSGLCSDLIVSERRRETLDIILTTPLRASSIVLGKFFSRFGLILVMVTSSFPLISIALLYGGVSGRQVIGLFEVTLGTILFTSGPALLVSVYARRLGTAAVLSQMVPIVWLIGSPFLFWIVGDSNSVVEFMTVTNPIMAAAELREPIPFILRQFGVHPATVFLLFGGAVSLTCNLFAVLRLRRERSGTAVAWGRKRRRKAGPEEDGVAPGRSARRSRIPLGIVRNPVLWKEINLINASTSRSLFWIMAALLLIAEMLMLVAVDLDSLVEHPAYHIEFACGAAFILLLLTVVNAATAIVSERDQGTLELLHVTPIKVHQILEGKAAGVLRSVALLGLVPILHLAAAALFTKVTLACLVGFCGTFGILVIYFTVAGLRHSIIADRPARAIVRALVHFAVLMVGYPVVIGVLGFIGLRGDGGMMGRLLLFHPMGLIGGTSAMLQDMDKDLAEIIPWLILSFLAYTALSIVGFRRLVGLYRTRILGRPRRDPKGRRVQWSS